MITPEQLAKKSQPAQNNLSLETLLKVTIMGHAKRGNLKREGGIIPLPVFILKGPDEIQKTKDYLAKSGWNVVNMTGPTDEMYQVELRKYK